MELNGTCTVLPGVCTLADNDMLLMAPHKEQDMIAANLDRAALLLKPQPSSGAVSAKSPEP